MSLSMDVAQAFVIDEDPELSLESAMKRQASATSQGDIIGRAFGLIKAGEAQALLGEVETAIASIQEAQSLCSDVKCEEGLAAASNAMCKVYLKEDLLEDAVDAARDAVRAFKHLAIDKGQAVALLSLASASIAKGDAIAAIKFGRESLAILAAVAEPTIVATAYLVLKDAYAAKGDNFRAAKMASKAMDIYSELGNTHRVAYCLHEIARVELAARAFSKVIAVVDQLKQLAKEAGDHVAMVEAERVLIEMYLKQGEFVAAAKTAKSVIQIFHDAGDVKGEASAWLRLGNLLMDVGEHDKAGLCAETSLQMSYGIGDTAALPEGKKLLEAATYAHQTEEIKQQIGKMEGYVHIPSTLIVDPGLGKRLQDKYMEAVRAQ